LPVGHSEYGIRQPTFEVGVVAEQPGQIGVVPHQPNDNAPKRLVVFDPGRLFIRISPRI
jgi:hypothetical protein